MKNRLAAVTLSQVCHFANSIIHISSTASRRGPKGVTVIGMLLLRLLVLPAVFVLTILEWVGTYILSFSEMFCRLITGLTAILAVAVFWIGVASIEQAASILIAGLVFYLLQRIGRTIVAGIALLHVTLANVIWK